MDKKLKVWNGTGVYNGKQVSVMVAAHSQAKAVELLNGCDVRESLSHFRAYYSNCWGNAANEKIGVPTEPCVYITGINDWDLNDIQKLS